jgi:hypothetical protein
MLLLATALLVFVGAPAMAFHDGGVAHCDRCHVMHNSRDGEAVAVGVDSGNIGNDELLIYPNPTDQCLSCHRGSESRTASYATWSAPGDTTYTAFTQAGDFAFLEAVNLNDGRGGDNPDNFLNGSYGGHSLRSTIAGTNWDPVLTEAPGSGIDNEIECTSCHDPHGNDGWRLLYLEDQQVQVGTSTVVFQDTMEVFGPRAGTDPRDFVVGESAKNTYKAGYSGWCSTCHGDFHQNSGANVHPSGEDFDDRQLASYNAYMGTTDCITNDPGSQTLPLDVCGTGTGTDVYIWQVPFEDPDFTEADVTSWDGATSNSKVACVSCHFAHASSALDSGRWDFQVTFLHEDGENSGSYVLPNPYDDLNQRSLCNKCHSQDEYDAPFEP